MKLYELDWALYPRRVTIYLAEKGIEDVERIAFDPFAGWPPPEVARLSPAATVPILVTKDGTAIRSSIAILEYLEELYPTPSLLGATPEARARTRELVSVIDEATQQFGIWCHKGSPWFAPHEEQSRDAARFAADAYHARLQLLDTLMQEASGPFIVGPDVSIADCITLSTLQFAEHLYGVPVPDDCPVLTGWYRAFSRRPSAAMKPYPGPLLAGTFGLPEACPRTADAEVRSEKPRL